MGEKIISDYKNDSQLQVKFPALTEVRTQSMKSWQISRQLVISEPMFEKLDEFGTNCPILVLEFSDFKIHTLSEINNKARFVFMPLSDPANLGAAIRSSVAFGWNQILLHKNSAFPLSGKVIRASAGASLFTKINYIQDWQELSSYSGQLIALDKSGQNIRKSQALLDSGCIFVLGEEGQGIPDFILNSKAVKKLSIPIQSVESLNASVAISIALYELSQKSSS